MKHDKNLKAPPNLVCFAVPLVPETSNESVIICNTFS